MNNFKGLAHIGLFTSDIEKSKKFYTENLGFKLDYESILEQPDNGWLKLAFINLNGMIIELLEPSDKENMKKGDNGCVEHLAVEVQNLLDVVEDLKAKGIKFETEQPAKHDKLFKGVLSIFFEGPNGERLELFEFLA
jgi:lactoylglutathione lyase